MPPGQFEFKTIFITCPIFHFSNLRCPEQKKPLLVIGNFVGGQILVFKLKAFLGTDHYFYVYCQLFELASAVCANEIQLELKTAFKGSKM